METLNASPSKASTLEYLSFGGGQFSTNIFWAFLTYYMTGFYIDYALISPEVTAVLFLVLSFVSVLADLTTGLFINRVSFKRGKYRPYYLWCTFPYSLGLILLCRIPEISITGKIVYALATLITCELFYTVLNTAGLSMIAFASNDDVGRTKMVSFANAGSIIAYILSGTFMMPLVGLVGGEDKQAGFATTLTLFAAVITALHINAFFRVKERHRHIQTFKPPITDVYSLIIRNWRIMLFLAGFALYWMADSFKNRTTYFYVIYYMGRADLLPIIIMLGLLVPLAFQLLIPRLLTFAKKERLIVFGLIAASTVGFLFLASGNRIIELIVYILLYGAFTSISANLFFTAVASISDEIFRHHKISMSEVLLSMMGVSSKIGVAIAGVMSPMVLEKTGYVAQAAIQSAEALAGIKTLYILCTAAGMALSGIVVMLSFRSGGIAVFGSNAKAS